MEMSSKYSFSTIIDIHLSFLQKSPSSEVSEVWTRVFHPLLEGATAPTLPARSGHVTVTSLWK